MDAALALCRLLHFAAAMLAFGAAGFAWALAPRRLAQALTPPVRRMVGAAILVAAATAPIWLALEAGQMGEGWRDSLDPGAIGAVAFDTAFGRVWLWRMALALLLVGALAIGRHDRWPPVTLAAGLFLASLGLVGHAAMIAGPAGVADRINHAVHLLCAGAWLGGLPPLILCLRRDADAGLRAEVGVALRRFSTMGQAVVALVVATGAVNAALTLEVWRIDLSSPYQALLAAKIAAVAAMIALAAINRYVFVPRLKARRADALRAIARNSLAEIGLGIAALALVSVFAMLAPA